MEVAGITLPLQRQQAKALTCPANELLYGGAAGGGKSHLMRVAAINYCCAIPKLQAFLFRRSYGELKLNHMEGPTSFPELLAPLVAQKKVSIVDNEIRFWTGSKIHMSHLQYYKTLQKYQGAEIHLLLMDELTHFFEAEYRYLRGRVRIGGLQVPEAFKGEIPRIISGTNPGSAGHGWVKRSFVKPGAMRVWKTPRTEGSMRRVFIPAKLEDNPALLENDPDYIDRLEALGDPLLVRAMKEGDWDIVAGAMFGDAWRPDRHVCKSFAIPEGWKIWTGADDGYAAPAAWYWFTENPDTGTIYVIAEIYRKRMLAPEYASRVLELQDNIPIATPQGIEPWGARGREPISGLMDSGAFADTGQAEIPRGNQMQKLGLKIKPVEKWPGSRVHRVQNFHKLLANNPRDPERRPCIRFFENCRAAIETIPTLPRDENNIEDVDTDAEDHAWDGVSYGLQWKDKRMKRKRLKGV
tara:strand:- start:26291 stop:27691 length:1401 start_codon:yes stop_codon:yes gene_type:complete